MFFTFLLFSFSSPTQRLLAFFIYISSCAAAQEFPLWWNLVPLCRMEVFFLFFFFGRSASREAMELWTVGQTFEANLWGCFGFRLNWVCVCVICVPVSFCVAPSEAWIPLCPWLMMSYPLSCKRQSVLIHALSAAPVPLESGQNLVKLVSRRGVRYGNRDLSAVGPLLSLHQYPSPYIFPHGARRRTLDRSSHLGTPRPRWGEPCGKMSPLP